MHINTANVAQNHMAYVATIITMPSPPSVSAPYSIIIFCQKTFASCACASDKAQSRRYEAVLDTAPSTNSMV